MCNSDADCETAPEAGPGYFCGSALPPYGSNYYDNRANIIPGRTIFLQTGEFAEMQFDGQSVIALPATYHPPLMTDMTVFATVRQQPGNDGYIVGKGVNDRLRDFGLYLRGSKRTVWLAYGAEGINPGFREILFFYDVAVDDGNYHSIAAVIDSSGNRAVLYIDGKAVGLQAPLPSPPEFRPGVS